MLKIDGRILLLIREMEEALMAAKDPEGVGLAAPQVGKLVSVFITKPSANLPVQVFINPVVRETPTETDDKIKSKAKPRNKYVKLEGCLSLVNIWGEVRRTPRITVSYLDEKGNSHTKTFRGFMATIIQHEMDHLRGILFPKRVLEQNGKLYKSRKNEKCEDIFEEVEI